MRTPTLAPLITLATLATMATLLAPSFAIGAQVYSWKDANGKIHYSDKPPLEKNSKARELSSGKASTGEGTPTAAAKEKSGEGGAAKAKSEGAANGKAAGEQAQAEAEARQQLCDNARKRLIQLEATAGVLLTKNEKGEQVPLVGEARKSETDTARKDVEQWCK